MKQKVLVIAGTRPEAIKMAPVVRALRARPGRFDVVLCATGQHRQMLSQALADFGLAPDVSLDVMSAGQTLSSLSSRLFAAIETMLKRQAPDIVLVQGDTTTAQIAALCAFYEGIPVGHVEAGLRSHNLQAPFPEELNRRVISLASRWHFAPTALAAETLAREGADPDSILVTGNTVIDSLLHIAAKVRAAPPTLPPRVEAALAEGKRIVCVTGHRRESFGQGFRNICLALIELSRRFTDVSFVYPVHLNPKVREVVMDMLSGSSNIVLEEPMTYMPFVRLMDASRLLLTDSGGMQEEGPSLGKPVLVMREVTERPEGVAAGVNRLVGVSTASVVEAVTELLTDDEAYDRMARIANPYGDGRAGERIAAALAGEPVAPPWQD